MSVSRGDKLMAGSRFRLFSQAWENGERGRDVLWNRPRQLETDMIKAYMNRRVVSVISMYMYIYIYVHSLHQCISDLFTPPMDGLWFMKGRHTASIIRTKETDFYNCLWGCSAVWCHIVYRNWLWIVTFSTRKWCVKMINIVEGILQCQLQRRKNGLQCIPCSVGILPYSIEVTIKIQ